MASSRSSSVDTSRTRFYLCTTKCAQGAFLLGLDKLTRMNCSHRKHWIVSRLAELVSVFAIDLAAYAVMSNHYHLVIHIDLERAAAWSDREVIERWLAMHKGEEVARRYLGGEALGDAEMEEVRQLAAKWRGELSSISTFMSRMNYHIACLGNKESGRDGHFWSQRFHSRALEDASALLSAMAYTDLNPVRADISKGLKSSDFTSIQARLDRLVAEARRAEERGASSRAGGAAPQGEKPRLMAFQGDADAGAGLAKLGFSFGDYLRAVEWAGRVARSDKRGFIPPDAPGVLAELGLNGRQWAALALEVHDRQIIWLNGAKRVASLADRT